jgi:uncharacterized protein (TIGR03435 family)
MKPALLLFTAIVSQAQSFDVATIKPTPESERVYGMFTYPGGRIVATNYTLKMFLHEAYKIDDRLIDGGPKWVGEKHYSLTALPPAESASSKINPSNIKVPPPAEELAMLRTLLAERFHLKVHEEMREGNVFLMTVDRAGHKLTPTKNDQAFSYLGSGFTTENGERKEYIAGENATLDLIADRLASFVGRPVVNQTGLTGAYDFRFNYEYVERTSNAANAIQQLGLRLTPAKGPIRFLVIDQAQEPDEN